MAILIRRQIESFQIKTTQRAIGTTLGVIATNMLLAFQMPVWALIILIGCLASVQQFRKARNFLAYAARADFKNVSHGTNSFKEITRTYLVRIG